MTTTATALQALLSLVRREAPHLSGKVLGDADEALRNALSAPPAAQDAPSEPTLGPSGSADRYFYEAGFRAGARASQPATPAQDADDDTEDQWRQLALQFDRHRMAALWHLRTLLQDPAGHAEKARAFLAAPPPEAAGLPLEQEPKYTVNGCAIVNRHSGEAIPADEPVFIFRARDALGVAALRAYLALIGDREPASAHAEAVAGRIADFQRFAAAHPKRMKWPDTAATPAAHPVAGQGQAGEPCFAIYRTEDGVETFWHAIWHDDTKLSANERYVKGRFVPDAAPTAPQAPALVPLTDAQILYELKHYPLGEIWISKDVLELAREVERHHGITPTTKEQQA